VAVKRSAAFVITISVLLLVLFGPRVVKLVAGSSGADTWSALWLGGEGGLAKVAASDGTLLDQVSGLGDVRSIAVDNTRMMVWTYGRETLSCIGFDGKTALSVRLPGADRRRADDRGQGWAEGDGGQKLAVDPLDGGVWLADGNTLYRVGPAGTIVINISLSDRIVAISLDTIRSHIWVSCGKRLASYDESGKLIQKIDTRRLSSVGDISFDSACDDLWVASNMGLFRYSGGTGQLASKTSRCDGGLIAADGQGGVWVAENGALGRLDSKGNVLFEVTPFPVGGHGWRSWIRIAPNAFAGGVGGCPAEPGGQILGITVDPADASVWVLGQSRVAHVSLPGQVTASQDLGGLFPGGIRALGFSTDLAPPVLSITSPQSGSFINTGTPVLSFSYSDTGVSGVDSSTISASANGSALQLSCTCGETSATCTPQSPLADGVYAISATIKDFAGNESKAASLSLTIDTIPPVITITSPKDGLLTNQASQTISGSLSEPGTLTINGQAVTVAGNNGFSHPVTLTEGANRFTLSATDRAGNTATKRIAAALDTIPPNPVNTGLVTVTSAGGGNYTISGSAGSAEPWTLVTVLDLSTGQSVTGTVNADGSFSVSIAAQSGDSLSIGLTDGAGNVSKAASVTAGLSDPSTVATPVDPTTATQFGAETAFLYGGSNPIQTGVSAGTIAPMRAAVIRGKVMGADGSPLAGVAISILGHPELGRTSSRGDGMFDMAVNGGGQLTVVYGLSGYFPAERQVNVPWRDYVFAPDVAMIKPDSNVTAIDLSSTAPVQVARGGAVTDSDGTRTATLFFSQGTTATMVLADGSTQPLSTLHVRATEYTVGANGPKAMPCQLPANSGYTYCVELSTDEAIAAGARTVTFSSPVIEYLDNFLAFPAGMKVPAGYYDQSQGQLIASGNGLVIKILSITNGMAALDVDGSGQAASATALSALGITNAELSELASLYTAGQSLWRVPVTHFSAWDFNWPFGPPSGAVAPNATVSQASNQPPIDKTCPICGSIIGCERQTLGEKVPIAGTGLTLHYQNDREVGHTADDTIEIPLTGSTVPAGLESVTLIVTVAGRQFQSSFAATANQSTVFTWDGKDAYGRTLQGAQPVTVQIGYVYAGVYLTPSENPLESMSNYDGLFGHFSYYGTPATGDRARQTVTLWQTIQSTVGPWDARGTGLGGWTLNIHHFYDPVRQELYLGDGSQRSSKGMNMGVISTVTSSLLWPTGIAVGPDGSLYINDTDDGRLLKVATDGTTSTVNAGGLNWFQGVTVGPDGSVYIADTNNYRVKKVSPAGVVTTVAGNGTAGFSGDGGLATQAELSSPWGVAVGPDGSIYIADEGNNLIRRVGPDGIITTIAGNGTRGYSGDGGPAGQAEFSHPDGVAIGPDGALYVADEGNNRIRRVGTDGVITTVAGNGTAGFSGDGGAATGAALNNPAGIATAPDGSIYIADTGNSRIRKVDSDGVIATVAGNGTGGYNGDGESALQAELNLPVRVAVGPDGSIYDTDNWNCRVRRIAPPLPGFSIGDILLPSEDGSEVYTFNAAGKQLSTLNALTGAVLYQFGYDGSGLLSTITDGSGNVTTIQHDANGNPTAIISPFGQKTALAVDSNGYLSTITDPAGDAYQVSYGSGGLMASMTTPNNNGYSFTYDGFGRLTQDSDPAGGSKSLVRTDDPTGYSVAVTTGLGRTTNYQLHQLPIGTIDHVVISPDGTKTETVSRTDGSEVSTYPDGTTSNLVQGPDPRFGMLAPLAVSTSATTPGGLSLKTAMSRTVSLSVANNPLSLTVQTDTLSINGQKWVKKFVASTRTITSASPAGRQWTSTIDSLGRVVSKQIAGLAPSGFTYDTNGRLSTVTAGTGTTARTASLAYDSSGYLASITNPLGQSLQFQHDAAGRVVSETFPDGSVTGFQYDRDGNLLAVTPPGHPAHVFTYTPVDQDSTYVSPGGGATDYLYNIDRQLQKITRPDGAALDFAYDSAGRLSSLTIPTGTITYGYDATTGNLNQVATSDGSALSFTYDGSLVTGQSWSGQVAGRVGYSYDNNFRVTSINVGDANPVSFQYDADGLLTQAGSLAITRSSQNGLPSATSLGNLTDAVTYDSFGELSGYTASYSGSAIFSESYTRDQLGRITEKTENVNGVTTTYDYTYDTAGRLTQVQKNGYAISAYTYDANGNRLSWASPTGTINGTYDAQDHLLTYGSATYAYTANGELQSKTDANGTTSYQYDVLGNLRQVTLPGGSVINYLVDGKNRRIGKEVNGQLVEGFLYQDGLRPIAQLDGSGNVVSRFIYAGGNVPSYMIKGGETYRIVCDQLGSPRVVIDTATGAVAQQMSYDEFGNITMDTNAGFQPFGFAGGLYDPDTGLVRLGARDYDPYSGRWTAKDPILFWGGSTNLYGYVQNNPVNLVDPWGLMGEEEGGGKVFVPVSPFGGPSGNVLVPTGENAQEVEQLDHLDQEEEMAAAVAADASYPATPIGRRGNPMNVPRGTNSCTDIQGRTYTGHALDQMQGRGVLPSVVEDTIATGNQSSSYDDATVFETNQARVVLNPDGSVKTVITR
jgi:RHS repeat-associated protein